MNNWKVNKWLAFLGFSLLLGLTYFRENFLLAINASIAGEESNRAYAYFLADFFRSLSHHQLVLWKWGLTFFFSGLMTVITLATLYSCFQSVSRLKFISFIYLVVFSFLLLLGGVAYFLSCFEPVYFILRKILGVIQSPIPFIVFFLLFYFRGD